jgi:hypothetical protein
MRKENREERKKRKNWEYEGKIRKEKERKENS